MSYESMAREEVCCDFPGCKENFYTKKNARVAIVKNGKVLAFCKEHAERLISEDIPLRPLKEIHAEEERLKEERLARERLRVEKNFIDELRNNSSAKRSIQCPHCVYE